MRIQLLLLWLCYCTDLGLAHIPTLQSGFSVDFTKTLLKSSQRINHVSNVLHESGVVSKRHDVSDSILKHMTPLHIESLKRIIKMDKENMGIFEEFYRPTGVSTSTDDTIDPTLVAQLAEVVPLLSRSKSCIAQSISFIEDLVTNQTWSLQMIDYSGKIPDGIYENKVPYGFNKYVPFGNHFVPGAYDACLNLDVQLNATTIDPDVHKSIAGRWHLMQLKANVAQTNKTDSGDQLQAPLDRLLTEGLSYKLLIDSVFSMPAGLDTNREKNAEIFVNEINRWSYKWGLCVPSACNEIDVMLTYEILLDSFVNPINLKAGNISIHATTALPSQTKENQQPVFETGNIVFICVLAILGFVLVLGTVLDVTNRYSSKTSASMAEKMLKCFSLYENGTKLLSTKKGAADHITCLGGIRQISMMWVVLGHTFLMFQFLGPLFISNRARVYSVYLDKDSYSAAIQIVLNALPSVDTFFFLSGLLVAYFTFIQLEKKRFNIVVYYVHRYIRLTIPYAFALLCVIYINQYIPSGPLAFVYKLGSSKVCKDNWWKNLLYLTDIYREDQCMGVTWYLSDDMQMYWYAPLVMLPIWWNEKIGLVLWCVHFLGFTAFQGFLTGYYHFGPESSTPNDEAHGLVDNGIVSQQDYYFKVYTRMQPYLIGLLMGYVFFKSRGKEIKIPVILSCILWLISVAVGLAVIVGVHPMWQNGFTNTESTIYAMFFRVGWSLALAWVTFACAKGYGGPINSFLSWGPFTVLGRLTFFSYLIHLEIIPIIMYGITYSFELNNFQVVMFYIGVLVIVQSTAFVLTLCFEMPWGGIEKIVMSKILGGSAKKKDVSKQVMKNETHQSLNASDSVFTKAEPQSSHVLDATEQPIAANMAVKEIEAKA